MSGTGLKSNQVKGGLGGSGGVVKNLQYGETFDVSSGPLAAYPKIVKKLTFLATDNVVETNLGSFQITADVDHYYPYTALKAELESGLSGLGHDTPVATVLEQHFKLEAIDLFTINKVATNSATTKMGFVSVDTSIAAVFHRADGIHSFSNITQLFKVNTTDDGAPPYIDDGLFSSSVPANHRSRSFSGFVDKSGVRGDTVSLKTAGELDGFPGFSDADDYYTNGIAGEITKTSITNSIFAGNPRNNAPGDTVFVVSPQDYDQEPDTDVSPDTTDGVTLWETVPEIPSFINADVALGAHNVDGGNLVSIQIEAVTNGYGKISYSTDKGNSWNIAQLELSAANQLNETTLRTMNTSQWLDGADYYGGSPEVVVWGNNVFIAYEYFDSSIRRMKGLYGTIDSNGDLVLRQSNEFTSAPYGGTISNGGLGVNTMGVRTRAKNGMVYISYMDNSGGQMYCQESADGGASFTPANRIKNVAAVLNTNANGPSDFEPYRIEVVDVPGQSVTPVELLTNGDFATGDITGWLQSFAAGAGITQVNADNSITLLNPAGGDTGALNQVTTTVAGRLYRVEYDLIAGGSNQAVQIYDGTTTATLIESNIQSPSASRRLAVNFIAQSTQSMVLAGVKASANATDVTYANFTIQEAVKNRVAVLATANAGGVGLGFTNLFYTDDQDLTANWATAIDLGPLLGFTNHLAIGAYLNSINNKWYVHYVAGHASADGPGSTTRVGTTDQSQIMEIDLSVATPTSLSGLVDWEPNATSQIALDNGAGLTSNSNGMWFFKDTTNIIKIPDGVLVAVSLNSGEGYTAFVTDMSDIANSTEIIRNEGYDDFFGIGAGSSLITEQHFAATASSLQIIYKRHLATYGDGEFLGAIRSREIVIDQGAKTEVIVNGTFDTDLSGWGAVGGYTWDAGTMRANGISQTNQPININFVVGQSYRLTMEISNYSASDSTIQIYEVGGASNDGSLPDSVFSGNGTKVFDFIALHSDSALNIQGITGTFNVDNVSLQLSSTQFLKEVDLIDKPNIDDQGYAGHVQVFFDNNTIHAFAEKEVNTEGTDIQQVVYNNYGLKTIEVATVWNKFPKELRDPQSASSSVHDSAVSPDGKYRVNVWQESGLTTTLRARASADFGENFEAADIARTVPDYGIGITFGIPSYQRYSPVTYVDNNGKAFVAVRDPSGVSYGFHGTIAADGTIAFTPANAGGFLFSGLVSEGFQIAFNNDILYLTTLRDSADECHIALSEDFGATWKDSVGGTSPSYSKVKNVGVSFTGKPNVGLSRIWVVDHPSNAGENRVIVHMVENNGNGRILTTDDQDLTVNWEAAFIVAPKVASEGTSLVGDGMSPDKTKLAILMHDADNVNSVYFNYLNISAATLTAQYGATGVDLLNGSHFNENNGNPSRVENGYITRKISQRIAWHSNNQTAYIVYSAEAGGNNQGAGIIQKIPDVDVAATNVKTEYKLGQSASGVCDESIFNMGGDQFKLVFKILEAASPNAYHLEGSVVHMSLSDSDPTANALPQFNRIDGNANYDYIKETVSGNRDAGTTASAVAKLQVKQSDIGLHASFTKVNENGFFGIFTNDLKERQLNKEVEEFRQVPVKIETNSGDVTVWGFDRSGDHIVVARSKGNNVRPFFSLDGGKTFLQHGTSFPFIFTTNNTNHYNNWKPEVVMISDAKCFFLYGNQPAASDIKIRGVVGTRVGDTWSFVQSTTLNILEDASNINMYSGKVVSRDGKLYMIGYAVSTSKIRFSVSLDDGVNWSAHTAVKNNVTDIVSDYTLPNSFFVTDDGSGGNRVHVTYADATPFDHKHVWSDDDGVTWSSATTIDNTTSRINVYAYKVFGNKMALITHPNAGANPTAKEMRCFVCQDLTAATPVWDAGFEFNFSTAWNSPNEYETYNVANSDLENNKFSLNKIEWHDSNSFSFVWTATTPGSADQGLRCMTVSDSTDASNNFIIDDIYDTSTLPGVSETGESAMMKSASGRIFLIYKFVNTSVVNNLAHGRAMAREVYPDGSIGIEQDIGFKPDPATGGYLGRFQVKGDSIMFEKEDGAASEQVYFNSIELRRVQKGE